MSKQSGGIGATILVVLLLVVAIFIIAFSANNDQPKKSGSSVATPSSSQASATSATTYPAQAEVANVNTIVIYNFLFNPQDFSIRAGTKVTWLNKEDVAHTITSDTLSADFPNSPILGKGQSYSYTFTTPGVYTYHDGLYPLAKGVINVSE